MFYEISDMIAEVLTSSDFVPSYGLIERVCAVSDAFTFGECVLNNEIGYICVGTIETSQHITIEYIPVAFYETNCMVSNKLTLCE